MRRRRTEVNHRICNIDETMKKDERQMGMPSVARKT
jgi:hypothetical protein